MVRGASMESQVARQRGLYPTRPEVRRSRTSPECGRDAPEAHVLAKRGYFKCLTLGRARYTLFLHLRFFIGFGGEGDILVDVTQGEVGFNFGQGDDGIETLVDLTHENVIV